MAEKAIFLDRDNTLIEDPGYINHPDQVRLLDGAAEALVRLRAMGYKLVVISNQSGVARGILTEKVLAEIHDRLNELLAKKGASLDRIYYCPYYPDGAVAKYRKQSNWRKPDIGMLLAAVEELHIDLDQSWVIGDGTTDIEAGIRAGCRTILIDNLAHSKKPKPGDPQPDYISVNIREAVNIIKKHQRQHEKNNTKKKVKPTKLVQPTMLTSEPEQEPAVQNDKPPVEPQAQKQPPSESPEKPSQSAGAEPDRSTENLLAEILLQLRTIQRTNMFREFSVWRLLAGVLQFIVLFCLLMSIRLLLDANRPAVSAMIPLGFAIVLQLMTLTFYMIHGRK